MCSAQPPASPGPIDLEHLRQSTLDNSDLAREVLGLFADQAALVLRQLASLPPDAGALAHTLKGSARAVGAFAVAEAASALERATRDGTTVAQALADLEQAVTSALAAVETILHRP